MAKEEQIKSQIILEGEKEYRAACKGINTSLREIGSEMKLATAEFGDNAESIEALTRKQDILQKQLDEQAKKAKAAEAALKKMREGGIDPTDPAYQKMQTNLNNTRAEMVKVQRELDDTSKKLKSSKIDWESVGDTVGKVGKAIGAGVAAMGAAIGAAATAFLGLAESTREARENMGKLEAGFTTAGHSAEDAKNTYTELYGILGDDGQATEAAAHLAQLTNNEQELATWTDIATGVYATFGDSLPIENLTEAANETAKTGQITGGLADALNWAGVSEDEFQSKLDACTTEQERQALITETLNGLYSDAAEAYREVNGDIIEAQKATANLNSAMAALGAIAEPIVTKLKQLAADLLQQITPFVELIGTGLTGALEGAEGAAQQFSEGLLGLVTFIVEQLGTMLPTFLEFALQMIGTLATGIAQALPTIIVEIVKAVPQIVSGIVQAFASLRGEMVSAGANLLHGLWEGISSAASWLWDKVTGWASSLVSGIKSFFGIHSPSTVFAEIGTNMGEGVGVGFGESMDGVSADMTAAMGGAGQLTAAEAVRAVNDGIMANIEGLSGAINAIVEKVITGLNAQAQRLIQAGQGFGNNIASGLINGIPQITAKIPQITQSIITAFNAQNQKFIDVGVTIDRNIASGMVQGIPQITSKVAQIVQPILTELRSFVSDFTAAGEEMVRGIWQGFQNMSSWLESRVRSMMREIVAAVEDEMDIASPSKVFAGIGEYMAQGLGEGFGREMRNVEKTIRKATDSAVPDDPEPRPRTGGGQEATFKVVQNIYANDTSYAQQQREAARQFRMIAREVMT